MKKKLKMGLSHKLIAIFTVIVFIIISVMGVSSYFKSTSILENELSDYSAETIGQTKESIKAYFHGLERSIKMISKDPNAKVIIDNPDYAVWLEGALESYMEANEDVNAVYLGTKTGEFYLEPNPTELDPTTRPWYIKAKEEDRLIWTDPYEDENEANKGNMVITVAAPVYNEDEFIGVMGADISLEQLSKKINEIKIGKKGYVYLLDGNNKVIAHRDKSKLNELLPIENLREAINNKDKGVVPYSVKENGDNVEKFGVFNRIDGVDWTIVGNIYKDEISDDTSSILTTNLAIAIISIIMSIIVIYIVSKRITKPIEKLRDSMEIIKSGDFTKKVNIKSKDEIGDLADGFNIMVDNLSNLVRRIKKVSNNVSSSSESLASTSEETSASADEVSRTVEEIAHGASEQAADAENTAKTTYSLDGKIKRLVDNSDEMFEFAKTVMKENSDGTKAIKELEEKTKLNNDATNKIEEAILGLDDKSKNINNIVETISSIAEQTSLLSLNASIEAARAGEAGKGFAVVADEIRKLADSSNEATEEIKNIILSIQNDSNNTVNIMGEVKQRSGEQSKSVADMTETFTSISGSIEKITEKIEYITKFVNDVNKDKDSIVESIENISSVSEETAAASQEVSASMEEQSSAVEQVASAAEDLRNLAKELDEEINRFKV
ncbi:methyl-accepting chemotaxis protein [Dethiothermospora halolimnae]|uniref:methyl-accepting chemotaxis protein n=1 Tax=Dethiothermospora halolimnae TaxID=3114390 RepID=UPI003CCB8EF3